MILGFPGKVGNRRDYRPFNAKALEGFFIFSEAENDPELVEGCPLCWKQQGGLFFHVEESCIVHHSARAYHTDSERSEAVRTMMKFGSFPEPFLGQSEADAARWRKEHVSAVLTQDVVTMEDVKDLSAMELLVDRLRGSVGSAVSFNSLARDLEISPKTVKRYVDILERMYPRPLS